MVVTKIDEAYTLHIPDEFHQVLKAGQEVAVSVDQKGRLLLTPMEQVRAALQESYGMWSDKPEAQTDSVELVNDLRKGERLDEIQR